jgi:uncharacterized membrane protein
MKRKTAVAVVAAAGAATGAVVLVRRRSVASLPTVDGAARSTTRAITIDRPPKQVYDFWRDLPTLAGALDRTAKVELLDQARSAWSVTGPAGLPVSWTAEIVADQPGELLAWRVDDGPVPHEGRAEFHPAPADRGVEVKVALRYRLPGGKVTAALTKLTGDEPDMALRSTLRRVKQLIECGHVVTVDEQPSGRGLVKEKVTRVVRHRLSAGGRP